VESDDEDLEVRSVDTFQGSTTSSVRRGKRLDIYKQPIEQQINDEDLYSDSDQEADTQSRASVSQVTYRTHTLNNHLKLNPNVRSW